jgi:hypothetical protein
MTRDDGFPHADIAVGFLRDVKIRRLRQYGDEQATTLLYLAVVLSSWEMGYRLTVDEADTSVPVTPERTTALQAVGLLDAKGKVPARVWEAWFRPAWDRREKRRTGGIEGARRRWHPDREPDSEWVTQWDSQSAPEYQSSKQSNKPSVTPRASDFPDKSRTDDARTTCPTCGDLLTDKDLGVVVLDQGRQLAHRVCPPGRVA